MGPTTAARVLAFLHNWVRRCGPLTANVRPQKQHMGIIGRKPITIPVWVALAMALVVAAVLTLVAFLLTLDRSGNLGGKAALTGSVLVLPLVVVAKSEWPLGVSFASAFVTYFSLSFVAGWLFTREKRHKSAE